MRICSNSFTANTCFPRNHNRPAHTVGSQARTIAPVSLFPGRSVLHLYQSNRLDTLAILLHGVLSVPQQDVYARETVIVQARGMGRWLSLNIAERFGICANVDFPLPAGFLWQLIETVLGPQPRSGPFGNDTLAWRLHALLATPPAALAPYLRVGEAGGVLSERKRWRLAVRIADVFDQYLVYRPDWLSAWEAGRLLDLGEDEAWQMALWRALAQDRSHAHRADLMAALITRLHDPAPLDLPERVVLFGSSSLPPLLLQILQALAERIDVALFALNPCAQPWGDIAQRAEAQGVGERLLAAWGAQGRVFFDELAGVDELSSLFDEQAPPERLLAQLQYDVLTLAPRTPLPVHAHDHSLRIHACHSPLRQVETLRDALLQQFAGDASLQPAEVVVLCPNIEAYAPYIEAVFGQGEPNIPYAVADKGGLGASPLLAGFVDLLRVPDGDWEADRLMALLEIPALAQRFELAEAELPRLREWIAAAGIRRGRAGDAYSWQAGIGRVLLGVALPDADTLSDAQLPLFAELVPLADLDLRFAGAAAGLSRFSRQLARWQDMLQRPRPLQEWARQLADWLGRWFEEGEAELPALETLRAALSELGELAERSGVSEPVGRVAVLEWLHKQLAAGSGAGGFLTGGVTFAQLMPMRNLPFRVVAVLGLDDGAFPRESPPDGFDLIARHPRRGDRARALDERWLFLETVLAARDSLLLFYTGRDARSDTELPPSTVIADLLDALASGFYSADGRELTDCLVAQHALQPFASTRFAAALPSFDARWAPIAQLAGRGSAQPPRLADAELPREEALDALALGELLAFARDSSAWFLQRLGVRFARSEAGLAHREPFELDRASQRALLALADVKADQATSLQALGQGAALLPVGAASAVWAERAAQVFAPAVAQWRALGSAECALDLELASLRLYGRLHGLDEQGLGLRQPGKLREGDRLVAWLQHLALCAVAPAGVATQTRLIGLEEIARYASLPPSAACAQLADWIDAYRAACRRPLALLPRSSLAYAEGLQAKKDGGPAKALANAVKAWEGVQQQAGEGSYASVRALWRGQAPFDEDFAALAEQLLLPLLQAETRSKLT